MVHALLLPQSQSKFLMFYKSLHKPYGYLAQLVYKELILLQYLRSLILHKLEPHQ